MPEGTQAGSGAPTDPHTPPGAPAGTPGAPATPPASGATPPEPGATEAVSNPEAKKYADEAAAERAARRKAEADLKKLQDAQLTAEQKRERDFTEMQAKNLEYEARFQRQTLEIAGLRLAPTLGINDPGAALALVQAEHAHEVKFDADGRPENLDALLKTVLKEHPVLAAQAGTPRPPASSGGATNPGRQAGNGGLTLEQIKAMSNRERVARIEEITAWEKAQQSQ